MRLDLHENEIRNAIKKKWEEKGWAWDTHAGQATIKLLPIISAILADELKDFKRSVEALTDNFNIAGMASDRAKDAVMLYMALKRSGMENESASYSVYAFLMGEKNAPHPNSDFAPPANNVGDLASLAKNAELERRRR